MNTFTIPKASWRRRLGWKILPPGRFSPIEVPHPLPDDFEDVLIINSDVHLSFKDRLRVLLSGRLHLRSITLMEHSPGNCDTQSEVSTV